ncbi:unnamed protein product [Polarella glacialis]|uniref:Fucosyltransferase n=1 Tax=Polarella glacialis TaxID=89957 RepID=A0A813DPZ5_POLGL|nr:unnamed protein product [Polarella glacialis]CAE8648658.1 unnamed protein product [Polarella glacialis]
MPPTSGDACLAAGDIWCASGFFGGLRPSRNTGFAQRCVQAGQQTGIPEVLQVYIAFENTAEPGYVSEKVLDGYASGAVAVYWGAPDIGNYVPPASLIKLPNNTDDKDAMQIVANQILAVLSNKTQWNQMMQWRSQKASSWKSEEGTDLLKLWDSPRLKGSSSCRMCRLAYNHKIQANMSLSMGAAAKTN